MKVLKCESCGKTLTGNQRKYCSEKCCNRESNRLKRVKCAQGLSIRLCEVCGKPLPNKANQKYHQGECYRIAHRKKCRENHKIRQTNKPMIHGRCEVCLEPFETRLPHQHTCGRVECKNTQQREKRKRECKSLTPEQKLEYKLKQAEYRALNSEKPNKRMVRAKCPGCGIIHQYSFEIGWIGNGMPRKFCPRYPACMAGNHSDNFYATNYESVNEMGNGARI